jgi:hypothetical protein
MCFFSVDLSCCCENGADVFRTLYHVAEFVPAASTVVARSPTLTLASKSICAGDWGKFCGRRLGCPSLHLDRPAPRHLCSCCGAVGTVLSAAPLPSRPPSGQVALAPTFFFLRVIVQFPRIQASWEAYFVCSTICAEVTLQGWAVAGPLPRYIQQVLDAFHDRSIR